MNYNLTFILIYLPYLITGNSTFAKNLTVKRVLVDGEVQTYILPNGIKQEDILTPTLNIKTNLPKKILFKIFKN